MPLPKPYERVMFCEQKEDGMPVRSSRWVALGAFLALSAPIYIQPAAASWTTTGWTQHIIVASSARTVQSSAAFNIRRDRGYAAARYGRVGGPLQCVPFARENSGIELVGNAATWWNSAVGIYERGARPEVGSVLSFRSNSRMRLGHVAVVSKVIDSRNVEIDHANWAYPGHVSRAINVVDVSPQNDWTAVRVELGQTNEFGSIYPTHGFIYDRPDRGTLVANTDTTPAPVLPSPVIDLRPASERASAGPAREADQEVAEAADDAQPRTRRAARSRPRLNKTFHGATMRRITAYPQPAARAANIRRGRPAT